MSSDRRFLLRSIIRQFSIERGKRHESGFDERFCVPKVAELIPGMPPDNINATAKLLMLVLVGAAGFGYRFHKQKEASSKSILLERLKCLPGTPREFKFRDLKRVTNNFHEKNKLGQGGFGVVYRGLLAKE
ncbi:UNVERIFIED_CONTAM: Receptor-like serine/threonine-protein kinase [Sesamum angustifolium]|uniref:Receptor-like serine/threonine-protein kinase n=1 Tax=Sesamum angustifolium TaxID=2727405 RepID=A0AAW2IJM3_9LAMI